MPNSKKNILKLSALFLIFATLCNISFAYASENTSEQNGAQSIEDTSVETDTTEQTPSEDTSDTVEPPVETEPPTPVDPGVRYDFERDGILSGYYYIDESGKYIYGIAPGTTGEKLRAVCIPSASVVSSTTIGTGSTLTFGSQTLSTIVTGDLNGDSIINYSDLKQMEAPLVGSGISEAARKAGDVNHDGKLSITDFIKLKATLDSASDGNKISLPSKKPSSITMLLTPGASSRWDIAVPDGTAGYRSEDDSIVSISDDGNILAHATEGSTFVYAVDAKGTALSRRMVTVLSEPATVSFSRGSMVLTMGQSATITPVFNHPGNMSVTWSSSDSSVCSVSGGALTAHTTGNASIRATLASGAYAEMQIKVISPITSISIDNTIYKLKPNTTKNIAISVYPAGSACSYSITSSNPSVVSVTGDGVLRGLDYGTATVTVTEKYSGLSVSATVRVCNVKLVAFTFDDGPAAGTDKLLDFLAANNMKATFFTVGSRLYSYPDELKRIVNEGHELGYHSYGHENHRLLSDDQISSDFWKSNNIVKSITGQGFTLWRAPGGSHDQRVLNCIPLPHIMWSVDTLDWQLRDATKVYQKIMSTADDGDIILLHDLHMTSVDGAIRAMAELNQGDFEFVTVTELLSRHGSTPSPNRTYYYGG